MAVGLRTVDVLPLPKFQFQDVGEFVDRSVKLTIRGGQHWRGEALKFAEGTWPKVDSDAMHKSWARMVLLSIVVALNLCNYKWMINMQTYRDCKNYSY